MKIIQIRCKAFCRQGVKINRIQIADDGTVRVWDNVARHFTTCHSLTARSIGKIAKCLGENNMLRPIIITPNKKS